MNINHDQINYIKEIIISVLNSGGFNASVEYEQSLVDGLVFNVKTQDKKLLIGKQGNNLHALEHLIFAIVNKQYKDSSESIRFSIDIDDYVKNRKWQLKQIVKDAASELRLGKTEDILPVMTRFERKFVHNYIQEQFPHLNTISIGEEPNRKIKLSL